MNKRPVVLALIYGVVLLSVLTPFVLGASWNSQEEWTTGELVTTNPDTWRNLDITAGAGDWVTGGYDFDGLASYATNATFQPFDGLTALTVVVWIRPDLIPLATDDIILGESVDGDNRVQIANKVTDGIEATIGNSTDNIAIKTASITPGALYCFIMSWSGSTGILNVYLNGTRSQATDPLTGSISAAADLFLGRVSAAGYYFDGKIYTMAIYEHTFSWLEVNSSSTTPDTIVDGAIHYYTMNEGSGLIFYDFEGDVWHSQEYWIGGIVESPISWNPITDWGGSVWGYEFVIGTPVPTFLDDMDSFLVLGGMGLMVMGGLISAIVIKNDSSDPDSWRIALVGIIAACIGFALLWV